MDDVTAAKILIGCLDLTSLGDHDTEYRIEDLCAKADTPYGHVAAVCIWPQFIPLAKKKLKKTPVKIATVVNFPHGGSDFAKLRHEIRQALKAGADEIDAVFPYHDFLEGNLDVCDRFLDTVTETCGETTTKIILETGELAKASRIAEATRLCLNKGVGFIKTSTGKTPVSATPEAANIILETIAASRRKAGFKASGGIHTIDGKKISDPRPNRYGQRLDKPRTSAHRRQFTARQSAANHQTGILKMLPQEIIRKKRNRQPLSADEISEFIKGITDGSIMDAQTAALTMAVFLNGLNADETVALTMAMRDSGDVLEWKGFDAPIVDKHSSGGVGDKVSLMLAPLLAACGVYVPMISGRGLGHTGGTLDKFDSIPGYKTMPDNDLFRRTVKEAGCAVIGQTGNLAPADKKIYAIRDVCGTVESIELITASILSKKLAAGLEYLVMDLKCGNGAFMDNIEDAHKLARSIVKVANGAGTKTSALITDMNQVLGRTVGNALEMKEAVDFLKGENVNSRLAEITLALCAELLVNARQAATEQEARTKLQTAWQNGQALEHFARMVTLLGGPADFCDRPENFLARAAVIRPVFADEPGYVSAMQTRDIGLALIKLKGGRIRSDQKLDYATGFSEFCQRGDYLDAQHPIALIHAQSEDDCRQAAADLKAAVKLASAQPSLTNPIIEKISA